MSATRRLPPQPPTSRPACDLVSPGCDSAPESSPIRRPRHARFERRAPCHASAPAGASSTGQVPLGLPKEFIPLLTRLQGSGNGFRRLSRPVRNCPAVAYPRMTTASRPSSKRGPVPNPSQTVRALSPAPSSAFVIQRRFIPQRSQSGHKARWFQETRKSETSTLRSSTHEA